LTEFTNEELAFACNDCDRAALAELFRRFETSVRRLLARQSGDTDADDLVQATFLEIARGKAKYEGRSGVNAWLSGIAKNVWRQHCIKRARRQRLMQAAMAVTGRHFAECPFAILEAHRNAQSLSDTFESLSEKSQRAFFLCVVEGLSARQAGQLLGTSEPAIWKRVSVTRKVLQRALEA
jgi:RNA polymerase sigma-70 factor, ECF subfamily